MKNNKAQKTDEINMKNEKEQVKKREANPVESDKLDVDNEKADSKILSNEEKYTTSPDGKYKIPVSEYDSDRLEENQYNIPQIKIPGYVIAWPHDIKANSIPNMVAKGWQFVSPNEPGGEIVENKVVAGRNASGETAFHYAMKMPESKYKELLSRDEAQRKEKEEAIKHTPGKQSDGIYATGDTKFTHSNVVSSAKMS